LTLVAAAPSAKQTAGAIALAICCGDATLRVRLERLADTDARLGMIGAVGDPAAFDRLMERRHVDVALVRPSEMERLRRWARRHRATPCRRLRAVCACCREISGDRSRPPDRRSTTRIHPTQDR
jgi:hypothetical protein